MLVADACRCSFGATDGRGTARIRFYPVNRDSLSVQVGRSFRDGQPPKERIDGH